MRFTSFGLLRRLGLVLVSVAVLFLCAGRRDLPWAWAYLVLWSAYILGGCFRTPAKRTGPSSNRSQLGANDWIATATAQGLLWLALAVAGLDIGRLHWSDAVPVGLQFLGLAGCVIGLGLVLWSRSVNRFFSSLIRIQRDCGHHVITAGPYRWVRHPAYAGMVLFNLCSAPALGSWLAVLPILGRVFLTVRRTVLEDRLLLRELEGYLEYAEQVRHRLLPGVW